MRNSLLKATRGFQRLFQNAAARDLRQITKDRDINKDESVTCVAAIPNDAVINNVSGRGKWTLEQKMSLIEKC